MFKRTLATVLAVAAMGSTAAFAVDKVDRNFNQVTNSAFTPVFGRTLPPIGYVNFCARHASECRSLGGRTEVVALSPERWNLLHQVNSFVNHKIRPVSDQKLYQVPENWVYPTTAGDCEDYVLLKKRYLEGLGFPAETLLITVVLDEDNAGHAILTVRTDGGDFILDNRRNKILPWSQTPYQFLKRQSQHNPQEWVALTKRPKRKAAISGRN